MTLRLPTHPTAQMDFFETAPDDPNIAVLEGLLADGGWRLSSELAAEVLTRGGVNWSGAKINSLAAAACPRIISGDLGYKLTIHATPEELDHFCNQMRGRGQAMVERAERTRRFAHQIFG
jgi:hypothetical protein